MIDNKLNQTALLTILVINLISTILHYTDNFICYDKYPQPDWITPNSIYLAWTLLTTFGIMGYLFYTKYKFWLAYLCLSIYSITGISSPAHYFFPATEAFSLKMNLLIWTDAIAGISLIFFILWSALIFKEWRVDFVEKNVNL